MVFKENLKTAAEFESYIALSENRTRLLELIHGEIVEKMPTQKHAAIVSLINAHLFLYLKEHPFGIVMVEARYQIPGDEHNARMPDISYVSSSYFPLVERGPAPYMPDLAVEVQSPDDSLKEMTDKATYYLQNGSQMVWLVYTQKYLIEVLTATNRQLLTEKDVLEGGEVLPGFMLPVKEIFSL